MGIKSILTHSFSGISGFILGFVICMIISLVVIGFMYLNLGQAERERDGWYNNLQMLGAEKNKCMGDLQTCNDGWVRTGKSLDDYVSRVETCRQKLKSCNQWLDC